MKIGSTAKLALIGLLAGILALGVLPALAKTAGPSAFARQAPIAIVSSGPLTKIGISPDLNCSVNHVGDTRGEWYGDTACGTFIVINGALFGPAIIPAGLTTSDYTAAFTAVSQSMTTGTGTLADPFKIVTVVGAGTTGVTLTETDTYVTGNEYYQTDVEISNALALPVILYRGGDCYLQNSDSGYGVIDANGNVACQSGTATARGTRIEQFKPITAGSSYIEDGFSTVWAAIRAKVALPNTCRCADTDYIDNGMALSWSLSAPGASTTVSSLSLFAPLGVLNLAVTKTADQSTVPAGGGVDGYTITVSNPNAGSAAATTIVDTLPAGFTYRAGSTTGATTTEPAVSGQTLTWTGPFAIPASGSTTLHFGVNTATAAGTYMNNATATSAAFGVTPTGPTAPITVSAGGGGTNLVVTKTADQSVAPPPGYGYGGGVDGYTITVSNPNSGSVAVATIVDTLPAGFTYRTGSTTGATTTNPAVSGQTLTWTGPFPLPGSGSITLHFGVNTPTAAGTYFNNATATSEAVGVTPTGPTAPITVGGGPPPTLAGSYTPVTPVRLMDTRNSGGPLGPGGFRDLTVAGVFTGAPSGVVLNVTVDNTTAASYLTIYPKGATQPLASNLNWLAGGTVPNLVSVQVGTGGAVTIFNAYGSTDVVVDLEGYFSSSGSTQVALTPGRISDTRTGSGSPNAGSRLGPQGSINVQVTTAGGVPATGVTAAILNVTVVGTTAPSFLTVYPKGAAFPLASNLNWVAGQTVPNRVIVPVGTGGQVTVYNQWGSTDVAVDVSGYFTTTATGQTFTPRIPIRIADTRLTGGAPGAGGTFTLQVGGVAGVPNGARAVIINVTVTNTTAPSFLTVYPSTSALPGTSDLNWLGGQTIPNLVVATLGTTGAITFYNSAGSTDVVVDLAGWFS